MKKILFALVLTLGLFYNTALVRAEERIKDFVSVAQINADGSTVIEEKITYDFGDAQKHGIYRHIPVQYARDNGLYVTPLQVMSVTDEKGESLNYALNNYSDNLEIKIGDPDQTITGVRVYDIKYKLTGTVSSFPDHLEFYWNVNGNGWQVPVDKISAVVKLPKIVPKEDTRTACFKGQSGSTQNCDNYLFGYAGKMDTYYFDTVNLAAQEGMTIVAGFPKEIMNKDAVLANLENVKEWNADIKLLGDFSTVVNESVKINLGNERRSTVRRFWPINFEQYGIVPHLEIQNLVVKNQNGESVNFVSGYDNDSFWVDIGDPKKEEITGEQNYYLIYNIKYPFSYGATTDTFYWLGMNNNWELPIEKTNVWVTFPKPVTLGTIISECVATNFGVEDPCETNKNEPAVVGNMIKTVTFGQTGLKNYESLKINIKLSKGIVVEPRGLLKFYFDLVAFYRHGDWLWYYPLLAFIVMFYLWFKYGRDAKGHGIIIPQYDVPDDLSPAEVGTLLDSSTNNKDISAEIIQLAVKGYLKITRVPKTGGILDSDDYIFNKLKEPENLKAWQKEIMNKFFTGKNTEEKLSKITARHFGDDLPNLISDINDAVLKKGYFTASPDKVKIRYCISGMFVGAIWGVIVSLIIGGARPILSGIVAALIVIGFGLVMPALTKKGAEAQEYIEGLKLYLTVAEKDRLKFHNAPQKDPKSFEKLLPYAMVLGVEKEWAQQFERIAKTEPDWYHDPSGSTFSTIVLVTSLHRFHSAAASSVASTTPSRSSGSSGGSGFSGGHSGGGFGGGGGGSW